MPSRSECSALDGRRYDENDDLMRRCLNKALGYVDRTADPPIFRYIEDDGDYEVVGWVWLTTTGELKTHNIDVKLADDGRSFIYRDRKYPPGVYYLVRRNGREALVSEAFFKSL